MSKKQSFLMGNSAIARAIVESGCDVASAYPGTPSTEILQEVTRFKIEEKLPLYVEWSVNEKIAFDVALAAAIMGRRSAVAMKQVGLNVASDSLLSAAYTGVRGGMVVIACDDPGPHSSQTEQDSRLFAIFAKVPVLDPADPREAYAMTKYAFELSEKWKIPVLLRPTIRVCHGRQLVTTGMIPSAPAPTRFEKDPERWAATPVFRLRLHRELNDKLAGIRGDFEALKEFNVVENETTGGGKLAILSEGAVFATTLDVMAEMGINLPIMKIGTPYPFPQATIRNFTSRYDKILVIEETDHVIEMQLDDRRNVLGRMNGFVPNAGELIPDVVKEILERTMDHCGIPRPKSATPAAEIAPRQRRPTLCPGCPERSAFYAIKKAFPGAIFPSDIGCYTLGLNLKAVDTVIDMGAGITLATGFSHAQRDAAKKQMIVATIGDSTFFHAGIPSLLNACSTGAHFVLVILDNSIVAMTGGQETPATGKQIDGREVPRASIRKMVEACGVGFIETCDPYDIPGMIKLVKRAGEYTASSEGGVAVVIAEHPCPLYAEVRGAGVKTPVDVVAEECTGCQHCTKHFECPALQYIPETNKVVIDRLICTDCGECIPACPLDAIIASEQIPASPPRR